MRVPFFFYILANPEAASFLQQIAQSDPDNALVSTDGQITGYFEASDHDYENFDAYKWQLWDVENGWYPGGVEDPNLLSQAFTDPQNILMLGEGKAYYDFRDLYQQVSGESASKAGSQNLMILGSTVGSLGAIRLAGLARTEAGLLASNPTSYFYSQGYKLTLMADEAIAGLAGFPTGVVFGGGGAMLLDDMVSGGGRYATALWDDVSSLGAFGRGVDSNPGQFRFFEVDGGGAPSGGVVSNKLSPYGTTIESEIFAIQHLGQRSVSAETLARRNKIDELSYGAYMKQAEKDIYSQDTIYRYLTESGYNASLRHDSVAGYSTTFFSEFADEVMSGAQITKHWPGRPATGDVIYRVEIPTGKLNGFSIPRPNGGDAKIGWEYYTNSYPEYGKGGWTQFNMNPVPLKDVVIRELR